MTGGNLSIRTFFRILTLSFLLASYAFADAPPAAVSAFNAYVSNVEARLGNQHGSPRTFIASLDQDTTARLRNGELIIEQLTPKDKADLPGALLHHWRGTAFVRGATVADFERLMKNFNAYPQTFSPQVTQARILSAANERSPDHFVASMRVRQHHVITVVMDTVYDISYGHLDPTHGYSISRSTKISEISSPGSPNEHALSAADDHGFLWRLNSYWSYEERDGGLYMQIESISLTRAIPTGLGWIVRPYVTSVPRESLEFTLHSASKALQR
jgi:hypothetical protein